MCQVNCERRGELNRESTFTLLLFFSCSFSFVLKKSRVGNTTAGLEFCHLPHCMSRPHARTSPAINCSTMLFLLLLLLSYADVLEGDGGDSKEGTLFLEPTKRGRGSLTPFFVSSYSAIDRRRVLGHVRLA